MYKRQASDWCDAVFRDGREDPSGACEAMADDEKWADATRINMRPPPRAAFMGAPSSTLQPELEAPRAREKEPREQTRDAAVAEDAALREP